MDVLCTFHSETNERRQDRKLQWRIYGSSIFFFFNAKFVSVLSLVPFTKRCPKPMTLEETIFKRTVHTYCGDEVFLLCDASQPQTAPPHGILFASVMRPVSVMPAFPLQFC